MCAWPIPMSADTSRVELLVPNDDRLIAAIDPVVSHAAERAGLSSREQAELLRDATAACHEAFSRAARNGNPNPLLRVLVDDFPNRVQVSFEPSGGSSLAGAPEDRRRVTIVKDHAAPNAQTKS
jgi:hypothetical protein